MDEPREQKNEESMLERRHTSWQLAHVYDTAKVSLASVRGSPVRPLVCIELVAMSPILLLLE